MYERLYTWVYGLLYSSFLGTFIVGLVIAGIGHPYIGWGVLLAVYFMCQYGEGMIKGRYDRRRECIGDLVEIALMSAVFWLFGLMPDATDHAILKDCPWILSACLFVTFALPPLLRLLNPDAYDRLKARDNHFYKALTALSAVAALASIWWMHGWALAVVGGALLIYILAFLLFNDKMPKNYRRPPQGDKPKA